MQVRHLPEKGSCARFHVLDCPTEASTTHKTQHRKTTKDAQNRAGLMALFRVTKSDRTTTGWEQLFTFVRWHEGACRRETSHRGGVKQKKGAWCSLLDPSAEPGRRFVSPGRDAGPAASTARTKETQQGRSQTTRQHNPYMYRHHMHKIPR